MNINSQAHTLIEESIWKFSGLRISDGLIAIMWETCNNKAGHDVTHLQSLNLGGRERERDQEFQSNLGYITHSQPVVCENLSPKQKPSNNNEKQNQIGFHPN